MYVLSICASIVIGTTPLSSEGKNLEATPEPASTANVVTLPSLDQAAGWFYEFEPESLYSIEPPASSRESLSRGEQKLGATGRILWHVKRGHSVAVAPPEAQRGRIKGVAWYGSQVTAASIRMVAQFPQLEYICFNCCSIQDVDSMKLLRSCEHLQRVDCISVTDHVDLVVSALLSIPALVTLDIRGVKLSERVCESLYSATGLRTILVGGGRGEGISVAKLVRGKSIRALCLDHISITSGFRFDLRELDSLEELSLTECDGFTNEVALTLSDHNALRSIHFGKISCIDPSLIRAMDSLKGLKHMALSSCGKVVESGLFQSLTVRRITKLVLNKCKIAESFLNENVGTFVFESISVTDCIVDSAWWKILSGCRSLTALDLSETFFADATTHLILDLSKLEWIALWRSNVSLDSILRIVSMPSLRRMRLGHGGVVGRQEMAAVRARNSHVVVE